MFEKQRGPCSAVQVFGIVVACGGMYVAGLGKPFTESAYPHQPPSAACYTTTEELYVPHHTNVTRVKTHNSATRISQPFAWRAKRESMAQAWRCHPATPPSFKTPQVLHAMALGDGCLRGLSLGGTRFSLLASVYTPAAGNALM